MLEQFPSADHFLKQKKPVDPIRCVRPVAIQRAVGWFNAHFFGDLIYAVKANPSPFVLNVISNAGVVRFDVASLNEIELVSSLVPKARLFYMNPVKSRAHIRAAYHDFGVRRFAIDHLSEAQKILDVTNGAQDLTFFVRLSCNDAGSILPLGQKYGVEGEKAIELLKFARETAAHLGVTFHVGSQAMVPGRFGEAIHHVAELVRRAGVLVERLNVGGGFPSFYKEGDPIDLFPYIRDIESSLSTIPLVAEAKIFAEPGRALVAESESLIVRVDSRRDHELFINDGGYGVLFDAAFSDWVFPVRLISEVEMNGPLEPFSFWGPTCDAADQMKGPFFLPASVREGDYIEIYKTGAYGWSMCSQFNGFGNYEMIELQDEGLASNYLSESLNKSEAS